RHLRAGLQILVDTVERFEDLQAEDKCREDGCCKWIQQHHARRRNVSKDPVALCLNIGWSGERCHSCEKMSALHNDLSLGRSSARPVIWVMLARVGSSKRGHLKLVSAS